MPGTDDTSNTRDTSGSSDQRRPASELDPHDLVALLEGYLLGEPTLTGPEVAARVGIPHELARERRILAMHGP